MHETFPRREQYFIGYKPDDDDHQHDPDHLVHCHELAAIVEQMTEPEAGQDGDIDLGRHQRAPGEGPSLLHASDDMHTFDELAEQYRKADETKFRQYAELAVACAKALAPYESPTYRAVVMTSPQPSAGNGAKVLTKDELAQQLAARGLATTIFGIDVPVLEPEEVAEDGGSAESRELGVVGGR